jgi:glycosyltransferase involved in cell wall biosynthesis
MDATGNGASVARGVQAEVLLSARIEGTMTGESELHSVFFVTLPTFELGPQGRVLRLAKGWAARGHATAIAALQGDGAPGARERGGSGVPVHVLTSHGKEVLRASRVEAGLAVRRFVEERRPKLVFALETLVDWHVKLGLIDRPEPVVTLLGIDRWRWERKLYRRVLFRALAGRSAAVIGNSRATLAGWRRVIGARAFDAVPSAVVHNPVDPAEFAPRFERGGAELVVGGLGRLAEQKGFDLLLRAFAGLPERIGGRPLRLSIQGSGPERDALLALAGELGIAGRCELRPHAPDVAGFLAQLHVLAVPSRWAGFENSALEGILSGVPVVCSRETGLAELEDAREIAFCALEPDALRAELARLLALSDAERAALAERARASIVAQLALERVAGRLEATLAELGVLARMRPA